MVHRPTKAKQFGFGTYATIVPFILLAPTLLLFVTAGQILNVWADGWPRALVFFALCAETFYLPYLLIPITFWLPTQLPWVNYSINNEFGVGVEKHSAQGILIGAMILLPGLPVLAAYDSEIIVLTAESWLVPFEILARGGAGTFAVFFAVGIALAIPDFVERPSQT